MRRFLKAIARLTQSLDSTNLGGSGYELFIQDAIEQRVRDEMVAR